MKEPQTAPQCFVRSIFACVALAFSARFPPRAAEVELVTENQYILLKHRKSQGLSPSSCYPEADINGIGCRVRSRVS